MQREYEEAKNRRDSIELQKIRYEEQLELLQDQQQELLRQRLGEGEGGEGGDTETGGATTNTAGTETAQETAETTGTTGGSVPTMGYEEALNADLEAGSELILSGPGFNDAKVRVLEDGTFEEI
jgi:predicted nuclease with TOPRIM domain